MSISNRPVSGRNEETSTNLDPNNKDNWIETISYNGFTGHILSKNQNNTLNIIYYNKNGESFKKTVNQKDIEILHDGGRKNRYKKRRNTHKKRSKKRRRNTHKKRK